jgi:hypothetical protein
MHVEGLRPAARSGSLAMPDQLEEALALEPLVLLEQHRSSASPASFSRSAASHPSLCSTGRSSAWSR